jgi:hypothetical protein
MKNISKKKLHGKNILKKQKLKRFFEKKKNPPPPSKILYFCYIFLIKILYFVGKYNKNIRFFVVLK